MTFVKNAAPTRLTELEETAVNATQWDRRRFLSALGIGAAGLGLAACAGPGSGKKDAPTVTNTAAPSAVGTGPATGSLSFAHWRAEDKDTFATIIDGFVKANPGVSIRQDIAPSADYQATELQRIKQGSVGDVFAAFRGSQFTSIDAAGLYVPLTSQGFVKNYTADMLQVGQSGGVQKGLPYQMVFPMPLYNKDLFDKTGISEIPGDWDSFLAMCEKFKGAGISAMAWPGADTGNAGQLFNSMIMNAAPGDDMCAKIQAGTYKCTDDWFVGMLKQYQQLIPYMQPGAAGTQPQPCQQLFATGKAAMLATGAYDISSVRKLNATFAMDVLSPITVAKDKVKYTGTYNATFILGVSSISKSQQAALKFVEYLSTPQVATQYANGTSQMVPIEGVTYSNKDIDAISHWTKEKILLAPRYQFTNLDVQHAVEGSCIKVVGGASPEQAAEEAQRIVDQQKK